MNPPCVSNTGSIDMKHFITRFSLAIACTSSASVSLADIEETTTFSAPIEYCIGLIWVLHGGPGRVPALRSGTKCPI